MAAQHFVFQYHDWYFGAFLLSGFRQEVWQWAQELLGWLGACTPWCVWAAWGMDRAVICNLGSGRTCWVWSLAVCWEGRKRKNWTRRQQGVSDWEKNSWELPGMTEQEAWGNMKPRDTELKAGVCALPRWGGRGTGSDSSGKRLGRHCWRCFKQGRALLEECSLRYREGDYKCCWEKRVMLGLGLSPAWNLAWPLAQCGQGPAGLHTGEAKAEEDVPLQCWEPQILEYCSVSVVQSIPSLHSPS